MSTYNPQFRLPYTLTRAQDNTLTLRVYLDGGASLVVFDSATVSVYDHQGVAIIADAVATVAVGGVVTYAISAATLPTTLALSEGWQVKWTCTLDGVESHFTNMAMLVLSQIHPTLAWGDLTSLHSGLVKLLPAGSTAFTEPLARAWEQIFRKLLRNGRLPHLILSPYDLTDVHEALTLALIFNDLETYSMGKGKFAEMATKYEERFEKLWEDLHFTFYDGDQDGLPEGEAAARGPVILTCGPIRRWW